MRHMHPRHFRYTHRGFRPGYRRYYRGPGRLLGMVGLAALGYSLLNKNRQNQAPQNGYVYDEQDREW
jgi:hypothetical protein